MKHLLRNFQVLSPPCDLFQGCPFLPRNSFIFHTDDIPNIINSFRPSSSSGINGINDKFLRNAQMCSWIIMSKLFEQALELGMLPSNKKLFLIKSWEQALTW